MFAALTSKPFGMEMNDPTYHSNVIVLNAHLARLKSGLPVEPAASTVAGLATLEQQTIRLEQLLRELAEDRHIAPGLLSAIAGLVDRLTTDVDVFAAAVGGKLKDEDEGLRILR